MRRTMCKSKIHRAVLTGADLHYEGSLTLDVALMEAADILPFEKVSVVNINTGSLLETYVIEGERGFLRLRQVERQRLPREARVCERQRLAAVARDLDEAAEGIADA